MPLTNERLELGDYPQYVCVRHRAPDLPRPSGPANLAELRVCPRKRRDGLSAGPEPPVEREGLGIGHCDIMPPERLVRSGSRNRRCTRDLLPLERPSRSINAACRKT